MATIRSDIVYDDYVWSSTLIVRHMLLGTGRIYFGCDRSWRGGIWCTYNHFVLRFRCDMNWFSRFTRFILLFGLLWFCHRQFFERSFEK